MGRKWVAPRGWVIELISLDHRPVLRVLQHGCLVGERATVAETKILLARNGLSMENLVEVLPMAEHRTGA